MNLTKVAPPANLNITLPLGGSAQPGRERFPQSSMLQGSSPSPLPRTSVTTLPKGGCAMPSSTVSPNQRKGVQCAAQEVTNDS